MKYRWLVRDGKLKGGTFVIEWKTQQDVQRYEIKAKYLPRELKPATDYPEAVGFWRKSQALHRLKQQFEHLQQWFAHRRARNHQG